MPALTVTMTSDTEDTDVFHVLTRKPAVPELVDTKQFVFQVDPDGTVKYIGKAEDVLKKKRGMFVQNRRPAPGAPPIASSLTVPRGRR
jgi:hypothetical protein